MSINTLNQEQLSILNLHKSGLDSIPDFCHCINDICTASTPPSAKIYGTKTGIDCLVSTLTANHISNCGICRGHNRVKADIRNAHQQAAAIAIETFPHSHSSSNSKQVSVHPSCVFQASRKAPKTDARLIRSCIIIANAGLSNSMRLEYVLDSRLGVSGFRYVL